MHIEKQSLWTVLVFSVRMILKNSCLFGLSDARPEWNTSIPKFQQAFIFHGVFPPFKAVKSLWPLLAGRRVRSHVSGVNEQIRRLFLFISFRFYYTDEHFFGIYIYIFGQPAFFTGGPVKKLMDSQRRCSRLQGPQLGGTFKCAAPTAKLHEKAPLI